MTSGVHVPSDARVACIPHYFTQFCELQRSACHFDVRGINGPEIVGCDPRLNSDPEEITRFFISHLKKPSTTGIKLLVAATNVR
jgi:hypothetical protein